MSTSTSSTTTKSALSNAPVKVANAITLPSTTKGSEPLPTLPELAARLTAVETAVAAMKTTTSNPGPTLPSMPLFMGGAGILDDVKEVFGIDTAPPVNASGSEDTAEEAAEEGAETIPDSPAEAATPPAASVQPTLTAPKLETTMDALAAKPKTGGGRRSRRRPSNKMSRRNIQMARRHTRRSHRKGRKGTRRSARRQNKKNNA